MAIDTTTLSPPDTPTRAMPTTTLGIAVKMAFDDLLLKMRLQTAVPQELYDEVYAQVFDAPIVVAHIDDAVLPPTLLQVDSASRKQFADSYYANTTFLFTTRTTLVKWLRHKSDDERALIGKIYVVQAPYRPSSTGISPHLTQTLQEFHRKSSEILLKGAFGDVKVVLDNSAEVSSFHLPPSSP